MINIFILINRDMLIRKIIIWGNNKKYKRRKTAHSKIKYVYLKIQNLEKLTNKYMHIY